MSSSFYSGSGLTNDQNTAIEAALENAQEAQRLAEEAKEEALDAKVIAEAAQINAQAAELSGAASSSSASESATDAASSAASSATSATASASSASSASTSASNASTSASAASSAQTASETAQAAAEAALDDFTDTYLGAKTSDPTLDNDGNALIDGALYFNTTDNVIKVYDLGNTSWTAVALSASDSTNLATVSGQISPTNNLATVAGDSADISTVAGISSDISTVAADATDIGTVAGISANVTTVAGISSDVTTVAADTTDIGTVAGISANVTTVAGDSTNIGTVATNISNVNAVAGNATNINTVAADATDIGTVAGISSDISTVAADGTDIGTVAGISSDVTTVAGISANTTTVAGISSDVTSVAGVSSDVTTVAGISSNVTTVAGDSTNIQTVASNITGVNSFADRYRVGTTNPTTSLDAGDLFFNTTDDELKVYDGSAWSTGITTGNATQSTDGTMSSSDKTKLDGIESGATADQTKADIDALGIDADTLDGFDTSASGNRWEVIPFVSSGGVLEVGKYIDFHESDADTSDYSLRMSSISNVLNISSGLTVNGNIGVTGNVDGRDIAADGTKLDGIESGATADQTKADIDALNIDADTVDGIHETSFMRKSANSVLEMNNYNITEVNALYFNDAGPNEGLEWSGGNGWKIYESPDNLTTNGAGNLQFVTGTTGRATINTSGKLSATQLAVKGAAGYFFNDSGTRTAFTGGDLYIQSIGTYYNYATNQYHGNTSGDNHYFRGNTLSGNSWSLTGTGDFTTNNIYMGNALLHTGDTDTYIQFATNEIRMRTANSQEVTINSTGVRLGDTGNGYFQPVSGNYGSIQIDGGAHGGYEGYSIGGRAVFMHNNGSATGIYNDVNNEWLFYATHNAETRMYYNGSNKFQTTSSGAQVNGTLTVTGSISGGAAPVMSGTVTTVPVGGYVNAYSNYPNNSTYNNPIDQTLSASSTNIRLYYYSGSYQYDTINYGTWRFLGRGYAQYDVLLQRIS